MKTKLLMTAALALCGCATSVPVGNKHYAAVAPASVQIIYQEPHPPYEVLAFVGETGGPGISIESATRGARAEAAKYGADAVLIIEAQRGNLTNAGTQVHGKAIHWK